MAIDDQLKELGIGIEKGLDPVTASWPEKVRRRFEVLQQRIIDAAPIKSGELKQGIRTESLKIEGTKVTYRMVAPIHYKFTDSGVEGTESGSSKDGYKFTDKKPPISALTQWANITGWNKWALQDSIFKHGIRGTGWYSAVVNDNTLDQLTSDIAKDFKDSILGL